VCGALRPGRQKGNARPGLGSHARAQRRLITTSGGAMMINGQRTEDERRGRKAGFFRREHIGGTGGIQCARVSHMRLCMWVYKLLLVFRVFVGGGWQASNNIPLSLLGEIYNKGFRGQLIFPFSPCLKSSQPKMGSKRKEQPWDMTEERLWDHGTCQKNGHGMCMRKDRLFSVLTFLFTHAHSNSTDAFNLHPSCSHVHRLTFPTFPTPWNNGLFKAPVLPTAGSGLWP
jgi:hypothetical protein